MFSIFNVLRDAFQKLLCRKVQAGLLVIGVVVQWQNRACTVSQCLLDCTGLDRAPVQKSYLLESLSQLGIHSTWCFFIYIRNFFLGCRQAGLSHLLYVDLNVCFCSTIAMPGWLADWTPGPVCCDGTLPLWLWCSQPILALPTGGQWAVC